MIACVFTGPTLSPAEGRVELDAVYLPPAAQGDLYRAALARPQAIGIIDGYFECVPAVWHKEILWALSQGIHVYGSASMGALRATELAPFGMLGVGRIFEAYRDGVLEDDDEVAVTHGPAETGFRPLSEAMVNIRPTLAAAEAAGVLSPTTRIALEQIAKSLYYPERVYPLILRRAGEEGLPAKELDALRRWLPQGQVNQKRDDALAMLRVMREALGAGLPPKRVTFRLARSAHWEHARVMLSRPARERPDPGSKASGETQAKGRGEDGTTHGQAKDAIRVGHPAGRRRSPGESRDREGSAGGAPSVATKSAKGRVKTAKKSGKARRLPANSCRPRDA